MENKNASTFDFDEFFDIKEYAEEIKEYRIFWDKDYIFFDFIKRDMIKIIFQVVIISNDYGYGYEDYGYVKEDYYKLENFLRYLYLKNNEKLIRPILIYLDSSIPIVKSGSLKGLTIKHVWNKIIPNMDPQYDYCRTEKNLMDQTNEWIEKRYKLIKTPFSDNFKKEYNIMVRKIKLKLITNETE